MSGLFRDEVLRAQRAQHLGSIHISHAPRFALAASVSLVLAASLILFVVLGETTRKTQVPGILMPASGALNLTTPQAGVVRDLYAREDIQVQAGQLLMIVHTGRVTSAGDAGAAVLQNIDQRRKALASERQLVLQQAEQRQRAVDDRLRSLAIEERQIAGELDAVQQRLALARRSVQRYEQLATDGYVSSMVLQRAQEELLDLQGRERGVQRSMTSTAREVATLRNEKASAETSTKTQLVQIDRALAAVAQEGTEQRARTEVAITAPQAGMVTLLGVHAGQAVQPNQTLATLVPQAGHGEPSPLEAHLFATSRTAGFVQAGQTVWLRYAAYPYQKFGMAQARIVNVSRTPVDPHDLPSGHAQALLLAARSHEPLYRITATLTRQSVRTYGKTQALKPGMAFEAHVIQDRRALWEWLFEPLISVSASVRPP
jgi:membrane fusion protein